MLVQCYNAIYAAFSKTSSNSAILFLGAFHFFTPREGQRCAACHIALSEGKPWLHMYVHTKHTYEKWSRHEGAQATAGARTPLPHWHQLQ